MITSLGKTAGYFDCLRFVRCVLSDVVCVVLKMYRSAKFYDNLFSLLVCFYEIKFQTIFFFSGKMHTEI